MTTPEENKAIARRFSKVIESGDTSVFEDVVADGAIDHHTPPGPQPAGLQTWLLPSGRLRPDDAAAKLMPALPV